MSTLDPDDIPSNTSDNAHFSDIVQQAMSRRTLLKGGLGLGALMFMGGFGLAGCSSDDEADGGEPAGPLMGFTAVATSSGDSIVLPPGYSHHILQRWGDPLFTHSPAWQGDASNTGSDQALQIGDNHDGMHFFELAGANPNNEGLLVVNHEYTNYEYLFKPEAGQTSPIEPWTLDKVRKAQHAHGLSVLHVRRNAASGRWEVVIPSIYNRRITGNTPMLLTGPAAGHTLLRTSADPFGMTVLGTLNNCANGYTPWGTYLACEENFQGYFGTTGDSDTRDDLMKRYGVSALKSGYRWEEFDARFDYAGEPNECNRFGWVVEIDPTDPTSTPKKRTALGRIKHEGATLVLAADNRVVVYMGDDQAGDYIYKFISSGTYNPNNPAANRNLLDSGTLYVAVFASGATTGDYMGTGQWIALDKTSNATLAADSRFADQAEVLIKTRWAADAVGATKMDRPEWITVHPTTNEVYCTLTNNSGRAADAVDDANPRAGNRWGQIIRWREAGGDPAALTFEWDLFVVAGNPIAFPDRSDLRSGSANITADNTFNSPDGLAFDSDGRLWIQTDGSFANTGNYQGQGNNQMLCADPVTKEIRRFLVGPAGCEITGISWTPDLKTMFINVQHPGETGEHPNRPTPPMGMAMDRYLAENPLSFSKWPEEAGGRPRSATVVITKDDGGKIGS